jgi:hypothetical protein
VFNKPYPTRYEHFATSPLTSKHLDLFNLTIGSHFAIEAVLKGGTMHSNLLILQWKCLKFTLLLVLGVSVSLTAQEFRIPNKEIIIYLDNSASIVRNSSDAPSQQLSSMLVELLSPETDILNDNDTLSVLAFGPRFVTEFSRSNMIAKDNQWQSLLEDFGSPRAGDDETDFAIVFQDMQQRIANTDDPDALRIFIIASDFVHDPDNTVKTKGLNNLDDVRKKVDQHWRSLQPSLNNLRSAGSDSFTGNDTTNFLLLLKTAPYVKSTSSDFYKAAARNLGQLLTNALADGLDASIINYTPGQLSAHAFATTIRRKLTRWVSFEVEGIVEKPNGTIDVRLLLQNPNTFPVQLTEVGVALDERADPEPIQIAPIMVNPGKRNPLTLENLDRQFHQTSLYFYPKQNPEPQGLRKASRASGLNFADLAIEDLKVTDLISHHRSLLIEAEIRLARREQVTADLLLIRNGTDPVANGSDRYLLESNYTLTDSDGLGRARVYLHFKDPNFDFPEWQQFSLALAVKSQGAPFLKKEPLATNSNNALKTYPFFVSTLLSTFLLIILFLISYTITPGSQRKGLLDPLFWSAIATTVSIFVLYWFSATTIPGLILASLAFVPGFIVALIFCRYRASRFDQKLEHLSEAEIDFVPEDKVHGFIIRLFIYAIFICLAIAYVVFQIIS